MKWITLHRAWSHCWTEQIVRSTWIRIGWRMDTGCFHMEKFSPFHCKTHSHQQGILMKYSKKLFFVWSLDWQEPGHLPNLTRFLSFSVMSDGAALQRPCFQMHWLSSMHVVQSLNSPQTHSGLVEPSSQLTPTEQPHDPCSVDGGLNCLYRAASDLSLLA